MQTLNLAGLSLLLLEDEVLLRKQLAAYLTSLGMDVTATGDLATARRFVADLNLDFALLDVNLPDGRGTDLLKERAFSPSTGVVVMTADGGVRGAVEAMRLGALDYLVKPFDPEELPLVLHRVRRARQTARVEEHRRAEPGQPEFIFGVALADIARQLERILAADRRMETGLPPVLIHGETGTGKTSIARWLHRQGPRAEQPLVEVNCSALPETLAESELFGHERGAFTDARTARIGLFEAASGGTLFLDELPSLSSPLQAKVLTAIEDRVIRRLGGNKSIEVDVRVIAATNQDLKTLVAAKQFREDLLHRLDLFRIHLPPLRQRGNDLAPMADALLERICRRHRVPLRRLSEAGRRRLGQYAWPGNVRELAHELERAIVFSDRETLDLEMLPVGEGGEGGPANDPRDWFNLQYRFPDQGFSLEDATNRLVHHALKQTDGNVSAAARLLGVSRDVVRYRLAGGKKDAGPSPESPA